MKRFARILALVLVLTMFAACTQTPVNSGSTPVSQSSAGAVSGTAPDATASEFVYPMEGNPKFTYWIRLETNISPLVNNAGETNWAKLWQERTGVELTFEHPAGTTNDQLIEALNIVFASGNYPDIIHFDFSLMPGGVQKLYNEGIIHKLTEYIDGANPEMPNLKAALESKEEWDYLTRADDSEIYRIPPLMDGVLLAISQGAIVRNDLLKKYNLSPPETIAEWDNVLTTIMKNGDVEIGFIHEQYSRFLELWVRAWGITDAFYQRDGVVKFGPMEPEYKEFMATMADWYARGLIDQNFINGKRQDQDAAYSSGRAFATMASGGQGLGVFIPLLEQNLPEAELLAIPRPVLNHGDQVSDLPVWLVKSQGQAVITSNVKDDRMAQALRFMDYYYSEEGQVLSNWGIEGESFYYDSDGKPHYGEEITNHPDRSFAQSLAFWCLVNTNGPFMQQEGYIIDYWQHPIQRDAFTAWHKNLKYDSGNLDATTFTAEEASEFSRVYRDIKSYVDENTQLFIRGDKPLSEFDSFVADLEKMNVAQAIQLRQDAYDRFANR